jgi:hypothetical protein
VTVGAPTRAAAQQEAGASLSELPIGVESRWASPENPAGAKGAAARANAGRKGSPTIALAAGRSVVLAEAHGTSGTVRRMWMTIYDATSARSGRLCCGARLLRSLRLDIYWDGARTPAVSAPLGDFFGLGLAEMVPFESALFASPEGRSLVSHVPMPFRSGMRIVLTNEGTTDLPSIYYDVDYTVGDVQPPTMGYFHAHWRRERPTQSRRDYEILPRVAGRGRFLGATIGVVADTAHYQGTWWGEGEVKVYLDGDDSLPTLSGTGTEDYIGTAWGEGKFVNRFTGAPVSDAAAGRFAFYRYNVLDPIYFHREARVTIQQIGYLGAPEREAMRAALRRSGRRLVRAGAGDEPLDPERGGLFERADDWSSCAYFYLDRPENGLPPLAPVAERTAGT